MKPQSATSTLDGPDASPHVREMSADEKPAKTPATPREAKLAQALRANLRRRKTGAGPAPGKSEDKD